MEQNIIFPPWRRDRRQTKIRSKKRVKLANSVFSCVVHSFVFVVFFVFSFARPGRCFCLLPSTHVTRGQMGMHTRCQCKTEYVTTRHYYFFFLHFLPPPSTGKKGWGLMQFAFVFLLAGALVIVSSLHILLATPHGISSGCACNNVSSISGAFLLAAI